MKRCRRTILVLILMLLMCFWVSGLSFAVGDADKDQVKTKGLYVRNGALMRDGNPYRGIGANYQLLFGRLVTNNDDTSTLDNLVRLAKAGIPFVRFRANGFRAIGYRLYFKDRSEFFRRMDQVVRCAEENKIGLIPSLFWPLQTVAALVNEPPSQFGNPNSKCNAFVRQFTQEMVLRYRDSPAIWGWEFTNEANLATDLPNGPIARENDEFGPSAEEPRSVRLSSKELRMAYFTFAKTVRSLDPFRIIDTGNSVPRRSAWHNAHGQFWRADSEQQLATMMLDQNPDPFDVISVHIYQRTQKLAPFGRETVSHFIGRYTKLAAQAHKPLFIGEFPTGNRRQTEEYLAAIEEHRVPLSAFWVFDYPPQAKTTNVDFQNERSFVIDLVARANNVLQDRGSARQP